MNGLKQGRGRGSGVKGFTLIELLVVIAIIALLISILLPALGAAREQAAATVCAADLHAVGQISAMYTNDNDGWQAPGQWYWNGIWPYDNVPGTPPINRINYIWCNYLAPYTSTYKIFNCPTMTKGTVIPNLDGTGGRPGYDTEMIQTPGQDGEPLWDCQGRSSVGVSSNLAYTMWNCWQENEDTTASGTNPHPSQNWVSLDEKVEQIMVDYQTQAPEVGTPFMVMDGVLFVQDISPTQTYSAGRDWYYPHSGKTSNFLYYDYHVERHTKNDVSGKTVWIEDRGANRMHIMIGTK